MANKPQPRPIKANPAVAATPRPAGPPSAAAAAAGGRYAPLPRSLQAKTYDTSSPKYKAAARKYTGFMISVPILIVTSYVLFDRLVLGAEQKRMRLDPVDSKPAVPSPKTEG